MLITAFKKSVSCNLRRITACVTYRNRTKIKIARCCNELNLLSTSPPDFITSRIYSTEQDSESRTFLPKLVNDAPIYIPTFLTPLKLLYLSIFKIPYIDKDFEIAEFLKGAKYATTVISKALTNKDYESLQDLVTEDMLETLKAKIETLSPNQRQLIAIEENDILFYILSDINATTEKEHSIEITTTCHYMQNLTEERKSNLGFLELGTSSNHLMCNYKFIRKYVNNIGGPWIASLVNHYTMGQI